MRIKESETTIRYLDLCKRYGMDKDTAIRIRRLAMKYERLQEKYCSDPTWGEKDEQEGERIRAKIRRLVPSDIPIRFTGDPRGYCVRIFFPSGEYNTWGGRESGYGVPTEKE